MSVRLEIRPSWKHTCSLCGRTWHYPTTQAKDQNGIFSVQLHMEAVHNLPGPTGMEILWEKDHYPWIRKP